MYGILSSPKQVKNDILQNTLFWSIRVPELMADQVFLYIGRWKTQCTFYHNSPMHSQCQVDDL